MVALGVGSSSGYAPGLADVLPTSLAAVAVEWMNRDHADALQLIRTLGEVAEAARLGERTHSDVDRALGELAEHSRRHFHHEEREMRRTGFPPYEIHRQEHERLLSIFAQTVAQWQSDRDAEALARWVRVALAPWLVEHVQTLDAVTAAWIEGQSDA